VKDIAEIRKLPVTERLHLVGEIWDSILEDPDLLPVSGELARELDARLAAHRADPRGSVPWEVVDREVFGAD
jgi:putative addiction module component (TIGR02574 family)